MHTTAQKPSFGIDAPLLVLGFAILGPLLLISGLWLGQHPGASHSMVDSMLLTGMAMVLSAILMTCSSMAGKRRVAGALVRSLQLRGDERVLDVGCGRGMLMIAAARLLPRGSAVGIDLWNTHDQSGNAAVATLANVCAAGVDARVVIDTGDMRALPYADESCDAVISSLAIHNLPSSDDRAQALREIVRVLKPGGRIALLDFRNTGVYARVLREHGVTDARASWPNLLMFPPVRIVRGHKV